MGGRAFSIGNYIIDISTGLVLAKFVTKSYIFNNILARESSRKFIFAGG